MGKRGERNYRVIQRQLEAQKLDAEYHRDEMAKQAFRTESAYQLMDLNESYKLFKPGMTIVDLGCAPGSWTQVAVNATKAKYSQSHSLVIGVDMKETEDIEGAHLIHGLDFSLEDSQDTVIKALRNRHIDVLLSDMAYQTVGDDTCVTNLYYSVLEFLKKGCVQGASMVMRVFPCRDRKELMKCASDLFKRFHVIPCDKNTENAQDMFFVGLEYKARKR